VLLEALLVFRPPVNLKKHREEVGMRPVLKLLKEEPGIRDD
jgi:hypothetical protein